MPCSEADAKSTASSQQSAGNFDVDSIRENENQQIKEALTVSPPIGRIQIV